MILSMTGAGKAIVRYADKSITIFVKSLNSKQCDISTRLPQLYRERELDIRSLVADYLTRGKIDLSITMDDATSNLGNTQSINHEALKHYLTEINKLQANIALSPEQSTIQLYELLRLPGVLASNDGQTEELSQEEWQALKSGIEEALQDLITFRRQEGDMLKTALMQRISEIRHLLSLVDIPEAERITYIRQKLEDGLKKLSPEAYDRGRLEQELIYYIEKLDINEEKDRLAHHLKYFEELLSKPEGQQGRTLGFVAQEIGREINTLGSKSNNAELQQIVVKMKDELEQIKEQSLNVL